MHKVNLTKMSDVILNLLILVTSMAFLSIKMLLGNINNNKLSYHTFYKIKVEFWKEYLDVCLVKSLSLLCESFILKFWIKVFFTYLVL